MHAAAKAHVVELARHARVGLSDAQGAEHGAHLQARKRPWQLDAIRRAPAHRHDDLTRVGDGFIGEADVEARARRAGASRRVDAHGTLADLDAYAERRGRRAQGVEHARCLVRQGIQTSLGFLAHPKAHVLEALEHRVALTQENRALPPLLEEFVLKHHKGAGDEFPVVVRGSLYMGVRDVAAAVAGRQDAAAHPFVVGLVYDDARALARF